MDIKKDDQNKMADELEIVRLTNKFFPESKGYISNETGLSFWDFISAMKSGFFQCDYSCEPFGVPPGPDLGLSKKGGFQGDDQSIYSRLLEHANFHPDGRCIIVYDALGLKGWSTNYIRPIICSHKMVGQRIEEFDSFFDEYSDSLFIFESGEAMAIDHDLRFFWSKSKQVQAKNLGV